MQLLARHCQGIGYQTRSDVDGGGCCSRFDPCTCGKTYKDAEEDGSVRGNDYTDFAAHKGSCKDAENFAKLEKWIKKHPKKTKISISALHKFVMKALGIYGRSKKVAGGGCTSVKEPLKGGARTKLEGIIERSSLDKDTYKFAD